MLVALGKLGGTSRRAGSRHSQNSGFHQSKEGIEQRRLSEVGRIRSEDKMFGDSDCQKRYCGIDLVRFRVVPYRQITIVA